MTPAHNLVSVYQYFFFEQSHHYYQGNTINDFVIVNIA